MVVASTEPRSARSGALGRIAPLAAAGATGALVVHTALVDPTRGGILPPCPFHAATGLWCPGCGFTRAAHHLLRGDIAASLSANVLLVPFVAVVVTLWWSWWRSTRGRPNDTWLTRVPVPAWIVVGVVVVAFAVARNLAPFAALAP